MTRTNAFPAPTGWTADRDGNSLVAGPRGLAERYEDEDEAGRRVRRIHVSQEGAAVLQRIRTIRIDAQMALWNRFTEEERQIVLHSMEIEAKAARRMRDATDPAV
ncbi:hypothetical protein [Planomonospora parontospora]|uniref:hypothetical protein n=1 Tax=Planomonospora parontospora TaxID=58119 RepID=UPI00166F68D1|nr:hypothetical protein [Planomonospora parontospora]GGL58895.1 hypothetical protein GCM10014719_70410 [Planomonospora parontospora subsp. antibiotica]GII20241.1 hypothetical protein Ppa05_69670 [Planomonospora parontospora subsp. antibiotica]